MKFIHKILIPFASKGDKYNIPDEDLNGFVNQSDGFSFDYAKPERKGGKYIKREEVNGLFYKTQAAIKEIQDKAEGSGIPNAKALKVMHLKEHLGMKDGTYSTEQFVEYLAKNYQKFYGTFLIPYVWSSGTSPVKISDLPYSPSVITVRMINSDSVMLEARTYADNAYLAVYQAQVTGNIKKHTGWLKIREYDGTVSENRVKTESVVNGAVTEAKLASNAVSTAKIANGAVTADKIYLPVGFVYVQFPYTPAPGEIFRQGTWQNISHQYAGDFFRAEGGLSASFGSWQNEGLPNIKGSIDPIVGNANIVSGPFHSPSSWGDSCSNGKDKSWCAINFDASKANPIYGAATEVRPRNYAIRIWKKVS